MRDKVGDFENRIDRVRRFDHFYETRLKTARALGWSHEMSPTDVRVFRELGRSGGGITLAWLCERLCKDRGYLCRTLKKFREWGYVVGARGYRDQRCREYVLTVLSRDDLQNFLEQWKERYW